MESILEKKPLKMSLVDYFDSLDPFDKRTLLNELENSKEFFENSLDKFKPWLLVVVISSIFGFCMMPNIWTLLYFGSISGFMLWLFFKRYNLIKKFKLVINHLTKRLL